MVNSIDEEDLAAVASGDRKFTDDERELAEGELKSLSMHTWSIDPEALADKTLAWEIIESHCQP